MVRNRERKTDIALFSEEDMKEAVNLVSGGMSYRQAASMKNVKLTTLYRYVKKVGENDISEVLLRPKYDCRRIFTNEEEDILVKYLIQCAKMCYGLDSLEARRLAFDMAVNNKKDIPQNWMGKRMAGKDFMYGFRKRHPILSLRKPEACSLSRVTSFNKHNVGIFYDNLRDVLQRNAKFSDGTRIFNLDETKTSTVQIPRRVLAPKGVKQLNKATSGEKGTLVTTCCIIGAGGIFLPPVMVFPRVKFNDRMIKGAPAGTLGLATPSGWMNCDLFPQVMQHFIKHSQSSTENPSILIYDNHESHLAIAALQMAKDNGVTILTIPPHCSHRMQPLDVSVFYPFQSQYSAAIESWMLHHPGIPLTIYDIAECVGKAFTRSMTPENIISGFKKTGIFPYDRYVFNDDDFLMSAVTDREVTQAQLQEGEESASEKLLQTSRSTNINSPSTSRQDSEQDDHIDINRPSTSGQQIEEGRMETSHRVTVSASSIVELRSNVNESEEEIVSPEVFRGYPKAKERKLKGGRQKGKSCIPTDTPVKDRLEELATQRKEKKKKTIKSEFEKTRRKLFNENETTSIDPLSQNKCDTQKKSDNSKKRKKIRNEPETSDDDDEMPYLTSSDDVSLLDDDEREFDQIEEVKVGDYVLVKFPGKSPVFYVGKITKNKDDEGDFEVSYLRKSLKEENKFIFPEKKDKASVAQTDIVSVLPRPIISGQTKRQKSYLYFGVDLNSFNVR